MKDGVHTCGEVEKGWRGDGEVGEDDVDWYTKCLGRTGCEETGEEG